MSDSIDLIFIKKDLKHFLVNIHLTLMTLLFYAKYGFYGWSHLFSVIFIQYSVMPLDDWLDKERPFPYYILPLLSYAIYYYPLITILAIAGDLFVNLRVLLKQNNFFLERLEGIGNVTIYVVPNTLPIGLNNLSLYTASILFTLFADSFHKIGHGETTNPRLMWLTGFVFLTLAVLIFAKANLFTVALGVLILLSLIPFRLIKKRIYAWSYTQAWFGFAGFIAFYYYLTYYG